MCNLILSVILIFKFEVTQAVIILLYISQPIGRCVSASLSSAIGTDPLGIFYVNVDENGGISVRM